MPLKCAVTGSSGYLGSRVVTAMRREGWEVTGLSRKSLTPFDLKTGLAPDFFRGRKIEVLVHCAYDFTPTRWRDICSANVEGSIRLLRQARAEGVKRIVFISSISAFDGCVSKYGRAKLQIEKAALELGGLALRPALIYGKDAGGIVGALRAAVRKRVFVPLIGTGKYMQYFCNDEDLCAAILYFCQSADPAPRFPIVAAGSEGKTLKEFVQLLAKSKGNRIQFVSIPWRLIWILLRCMESIGLRPTFRSDSVISLVNQNPNPDFESTRVLGQPFRNLKISDL